jgi:hypothetical protein
LGAHLMEFIRVGPHGQPRGCQIERAARDRIIAVPRS